MSGGSAKSWGVLVEHAFDAVVIVEPTEGAITAANGNACVIAGARSLVGADITSLDVEVAASGWSGFVAALAASGPTIVSSAWRRSDRVVPVRARWWIGPEQDVVGLVRELPEPTPEVHPRLVDDNETTAPNAVSVVDVERRVQFTTRAPTGGLTADQVIGRSAYDFVRPEAIEVVRASLDEAFATGRTTSYESRVNEPDGSSRLNHSVVIPIRRGDEVVAVSVVSRDLTQIHLDEARRERVEARIFHAQKREALGTMAAGIAHEINNPLTFLWGNLDYIGQLCSELDTEPAAQIGELVADALGALERIKTIVSAVSKSSRADDARIEAVELATVLANSTSVASPYLRSVDVVAELGEVPAVRGNEVRLTQLFNNLLINAGHAVAEVESGCVRVEANVLEQTVEVFVRDNGPGVPSALRDRVFEPFFTTKAVGAGTGLGLWVCQQIVRSFGGDLTLEDRDDGAHFCVVLPRSDAGA
ncbi:MAG: ATP-binding protein [Deltaproteobacteria bacterium]